MLFYAHLKFTDSLLSLKYLVLFKRSCPKVFRISFLILQDSSKCVYSDLCGISLDKMAKCCINSPIFRAMLYDLQGHCHEIFDIRFFSSNNPPGPLILGLKPFLILLRICEYCHLFNRPFSCMRCQWHHMHDNVLLGWSPYIYIFL
jgi:hypothetical protein